MRLTVTIQLQQSFNDDVVYVSHEVGVEDLTEARQAVTQAAGRVLGDAREQMDSLLQGRSRAGVRSQDAEAFAYYEDPANREPVEGAPPVRKGGEARDNLKGA